MKSNKESDLEYIVRVLRNKYEALIQEAMLADVRVKAAFDAVRIAEQAKDYLEEQAATLGK